MCHEDSEEAVLPSTTPLSHDTADGEIAFPVSRKDRNGSSLLAMERRANGTHVLGAKGVTWK
jgi:hypothetical protein